MPGNEFSFRFPALLFTGNFIFLGRKKEMGLVAMRFVVRKMHAVYDGIS